MDRKGGIGNRSESIKQIRDNNQFDVVVIGGGASGIGTALEATLRGHKTLLLEKFDFTKGTSSKTTKLIHGGVRYLAQGDLKMVREALKERGYLIKNAPHIVHDQPFIIPVYRWWEVPFYTIGLKFYDLLSGRFSLGRSYYMSSKKVQKALPNISGKGLKGGILYHDGQFDDSRLAMDMLHEISGNGGLAVNYVEVTGLLKDNENNISGVQCRDMEQGEKFTVSSPAVINATGIWVDDILTMDDPEHENKIQPSQGVHIVLKKDFMPSEYAMMIPKTPDGRVLFSVPWHGHLIIGTTDTPVKQRSEEPSPRREEIDFILETASNYFDKEFTIDDVLSVFAGLRPLAAPKSDNSSTKEISRNHKVIVSPGKLITVIGGKWTTYRKIGQDLIDTAEKNKLIRKTASISKTYKINHLKDERVNRDKRLLMYGKHGDAIIEIMKSSPDTAGKIHPSLPYTYAELRWCCENEMVVHLEDLLGRRLRAILLNASATVEIADEIAVRVADILQWDEDKIKTEVSAFKDYAQNYLS